MIGGKRREEPRSPAKSNPRCSAVAHGQSFFSGENHILGITSARALTGDARLEFFRNSFAWVPQALLLRKRREEPRSPAKIREHCERAGQ